FRFSLQMNVGEEIPARCLGETGALSFKKPTEQDFRDTQELEASLAQLNIFETQEEISQRREALVRLQEISNAWIRQKALEQNLPAHVANSTTGKIFTFGSYRLGVNFRGADIDSLLVVPRFITREEFFSDFQTVLAENSNVEDLHAVVDAFVPVLKMKFMGVEIDLLFAQIDQMSIPENFSLCENTEVLMRNMDERDVRSINGVRVTEDILNLVYNKNSFKVALKLNPSDQYHLMPILTPSYPSQNSTYNVQRSNRIIIERELKQGLNVVRASMMHKGSWSNLFEAAFFFQYRHYVVVIVVGNTKHTFIELCGLVESRLRVLVSNFEVNRYVKMAHVNCHAYGKGPNDDDANFVRKWFIGMEFDRNTNSLTSTVHNSNVSSDKATLNVDLSENISSFEKSIERGLSSEDLSVTVKYVKKSQLAQFISAEDMDEIKRQAASAALSNVNNPTESLKSGRLLPNSNTLNSISSPASSIELSGSEEFSSPANSLHNSISTSSLTNMATINSSPKCPPPSPKLISSGVCGAAPPDIQLNESSLTLDNHKYDPMKDTHLLSSDHSLCNNTLNTVDSTGKLTPKRVGLVDSSLELSSDNHPNSRSNADSQLHGSEDFRKRARISSENSRAVVFTSSAQ
ncbi:poly(A) polymerase, partial [Schistosoma bovis]